MARAGEDPIDLAPGAAVAPGRNARRRLHPILPPLPVPSIANIEPAASRRRAAAEQHPTFAETTPDNGAEAKPKRRRGSRGGRRHKKAAAPEATIETAAAARGDRAGGRRKDQAQARQPRRTPPQEGRRPRSDCRDRAAARGDRAGGGRQVQAQAGQPRRTPPQEGDRGGGSRSPGGRGRGQAADKAPDDDQEGRRRDRSLHRRRQASPHQLPRPHARHRRAHRQGAGAVRSQRRVRVRAHPRLLRHRVAVRAPLLPAALGARPRHGGVHAGLLPAGPQPVRRADDAQDRAHRREEPQDARCSRSCTRTSTSSCSRSATTCACWRSTATAPLAPGPGAGHRPGADPGHEAPAARARSWARRSARTTRARSRCWSACCAGVLCFIADLMRQISVPTAVDFMSISSYDGNGAGGGAHPQGPRPEHQGPRRHPGRGHRGHGDDAEPHRSSTCRRSGRPR